MGTLALRRGDRLAKVIGGLKPITWNLLLISAGCVAWIVVVNSILVPNRLLTGGTIGITLLFRHFIPGLEFPWIFFLVNVPLVLISWKYIDARFMAYSIYGIIFFSYFSGMIPAIPIPIDDPILAPLLAGAICGCGGAMILRSAGSAGGLDMLWVVLRKKFSLPIGFVGFCVNAAILTSGAFLYDFQTMLYSIIFLFTNGRVLDAIFTGLDRRKAIMVISDKSEQIAEELGNKETHGATLLRGEGAFSHQEKNVVFSITNLTRLPRIKELVLAIDPTAFIVVSDATEVIGHKKAAPILRKRKRRIAL